MANFGDKIKKAANDVVKSVKDQIDAAQKNIKGTVKDAVKSTKDANTTIKDSIRNNTLKQEIKKAIEKTSKPIQEKINNFKPNFNKLGFNALLPYKSSMITLLQSKGIKVDNSDSMQKIAVLFHDAVVKGKSNFEYYDKRFNHAEGESKGEGVDWATIVKICTTIITWLKQIWDTEKKRKEEKAERDALAAASGSIPAPETPSAPLDKFANETLNTTLYGSPGTETKAGFEINSKTVKIILSILAAALLLGLAFSKGK